MQDSAAAESQLIEDSKSDPQCFESLYIKYYGVVLKFIYRRIENLDDCREVTSIVFTKALMNIQKYKNTGAPFSSWLYRIALNEVFQFYRETNKRRLISIDDRSIRNLADESVGYHPEVFELLKKSLLYLSEAELNLITLRFFEELTFAEMGVILRITEANAKRKTYRVVDKLKVIYKKIS